MAVTVDDVVDYIGADGCTRWAVVVSEVTTYPQIEDALATETTAQLKKVTYPEATDDDPTPDVSDLEEALKRRVQRNLAMRSLPLSMTQGDVDTGPVRIGGVDPEIRRLEAPYRSWVVG